MILASFLSPPKTMSFSWKSEVNCIVHEAVDAGRADVVVAARRPGILAAADRAVADVDHVLDRAPDHALRACIGAAANGHHAGDRLDVGLDAAVGLAFLVCAKMLGPAFGRLVRIDFQNFFDKFFVSCLDFFNVFGECQAHALSLSNRISCSPPGA